jgi:hypothetical protein
MKSIVTSSEIETKSHERSADRLGNIKISWMIHMIVDYIHFSQKIQVPATGNQETSEKVTEVTAKSTKTRARANVLSVSSEKSDNNSKKQTSINKLALKSGCLQQFNRCRSNHLSQTSSEECLSRNWREFRPELKPNLGK